MRGIIVGRARDHAGEGRPSEELGLEDDRKKTVARVAMRADW